MLHFLLRIFLNLGVNVLYYGARFFFYYSLYFAGLVLIRIAFKLRTEVYNGDLKSKQSPDQAILITGATSGIGLALAKYFSKRGYRVIAGYYSAKEPGYEELQRIKPDSNGQLVFLVELNVCSLESITKAHEQVQGILSQHKLKLHALINNAGIYNFQQTKWNNFENIRAIVDTNLVGPMFMIRKFGPLLIKTPGSRIINVGSVTSFMPGPNIAVYGATKSGLAYFTNSLAHELERYGVKTVIVYPGNLLKNTSILTNAHDNLDAVFNALTEEEKDLYKAEYQIHRSGIMKLTENIKKIQSKQPERKQSSSSESLKSKIKNYIRASTGSLKTGIKLEESALMHSFENAVALRDPPAEMFAGNRYFCLVCSSVVELLGHFGLNSLTFISAKFFSFDQEKDKSK